MEASLTILDLVKTLEEKKATDILVLDASETSLLSDYCVIVTALSFMHMKALENACQKFFQERGISRINPYNPFADNPWIIIDYVEVILHIFTAEARQFYDLESIWSLTPKVIDSKND